MNTEKKISIHAFDRQAGDQDSINDWVTIEEPMEIRVVTGTKERRRGRGISITMRTPGHDHELAVGFLVAEGIIADPAQIESVESVGTPADNESAPNTVRIELTPETDINYQDLQRHFYATSSCGVCGKASLEALQYRNLKAVDSKISLDADSVCSLPELLRQNQINFKKTGGIHAAGLFDAKGNFLELREDVGRHNALDKLLGSHFLDNRFPMIDSVLVVSGRASFELLQKSLSAQIPIFIAVGAPSSLAIELAQKFNVTLIGFASKSRFNIYSSPERIISPNKD